MIKTIKYCLIVSVAVMALSLSYVQAQKPANKTSTPVANDVPGPCVGPAFSFLQRSRAANDGFSFFSSKLTPQGGGSAVKGSGTAGMIPKWLDSGTLGDSIITESSGKIGIGTTTPGSTLTVLGSTTTLFGVIDVTDSGTGFALNASTTNGFAAIRAFHHGTAGYGVEAIGPIGLYAHSVTDGNAVSALNKSADEAAIYADNLDPDGMAIEAEAPIGIKGRSSRAGGIGLLGDAGLGAFAGKFMGNVDIVSKLGSAGDLSVAGNLTKGGGSFKIDHPLDPENKYLYHSFVESPDMKNIYDGVIALDANGEAVVELPEWFGALNKDFRYLLTPIGAPGPGLYIAQKIANNRFKIAGGQPGLEVSWQITGIRQDRWANAHRIPMEEQKADKERGYYLHPELYDQPEEKSVEWARHPEIMRRMKQQREPVNQDLRRENR